MRIFSHEQAKRILRWKPLADHPQTKEAVQKYVDVPTPHAKGEAEHALGYQLSAPDHAALVEWVKKWEQMQKPRRRLGRRKNV